MSRRDRRDMDGRDRDRRDAERRDRDWEDEGQQRRGGEGEAQEGDSLAALKAILSRVAALLKPLNLSADESIRLVEQLYGSVLDMDSAMAGEADDTRKSSTLAYIQNTTIRREGERLVVAFPTAEELRAAEAAVAAPVPEAAAGAAAAAPQAQQAPQAPALAPAAPAVAPAADPPAAQPSGDAPARLPRGARPRPAPRKDQPEAGQDAPGLGTTAAASTVTPEQTAPEGTEA